jgi:hypothetical protein
MATINLLPSKEFEIILNDGKTIKGQYTLWAVKQFCLKKNISLSKLEAAMSQETLSLDDLTTMLLCAVEYKCRLDKQPFIYSDIDACAWIEEMGGLLSENFSGLMAHSGGEEPEPADEKKSEAASL